METKFIEVRDAGTLMPCLAVRLNGSDSKLAHRAGFGPGFDYVILMPLEHLERTDYDPYGHGGGGARTLQVAHNYLFNHWDEVPNNGVVCVEFLCGERSEPKESEVYHE